MAFDVPARAGHRPPAALVLARRGTRGRRERHRCIGPAAAPARGLQSIRCGGAAPAMPARAWRKKGVTRRSPPRSPPAGPHEGRRLESPSPRAVSAGSGATRSSASGGGAEALSRPTPPWLGTIHQKDAIAPRTSTAERGAPNRRHDALPGRRRSVPSRAGHRPPPRLSSLGGERGVAMSAIDASAPLRLRRGVSNRSAAEARRRRSPRAPGRRTASPDARGRRSPFAFRRSRVASRRSPRGKQARVAFATGRLSRFGCHSEQCLRRRCRGPLPPAHTRLGTIHQKHAIAPRTSTAERGIPNRRHDAPPGRRRLEAARRPPGRRRSAPPYLPFANSPMKPASASTHSYGTAL